MEEWEKWDERGAGTPENCTEFLDNLEVSRLIHKKAISRMFTVMVQSHVTIREQFLIYFFFRGGNPKNGISLFPFGGLFALPLLLRPRVGNPMPCDMSEFDSSKLYGKIGLFPWKLKDLEGEGRRRRRRSNRELGSLAHGEEEEEKRRTIDLENRGGRHTAAIKTFGKEHTEERRRRNREEGGPIFPS